MTLRVMLRVRPYTMADLPGLLVVQRECFPPPFPAELWWQPEQIASHVRLFPEGALCAEDDGEVVASATAHILHWDPRQRAHTWSEASDGGWLRNHDPSGNTLYGVDVAVRPAWRGRGVARALYQARYALVRRLGLERFLAGSRLAGYRPYRERWSPEEYAEVVVRGEVDDPVITPQLRSGLRPVQVVRDYLPDEESCNHALLMEWRNPDR